MNKKLILGLSAILMGSSLFANTFNIGEKISDFGNNSANVKYGLEGFINYNNKLNQNSDFTLNFRSALYDRDNATSIKKYELTGILTTDVLNSSKFYLGAKRTSIRINDTTNKYSIILGLKTTVKNCKLNVNYIYTPNIEGNTGLNQANFVTTKKIGQLTVSNALTLQRFTQDETIFGNKNFVSDIIKGKYKFNNIFSLKGKLKLGQSVHKVDPYKLDFNILPFKEKYGAGLGVGIKISKNVNLNISTDYTRNNDGKDNFNIVNTYASLNFKF